eukprot:CAMPEP_0117750408 /NCGR_PEP_ID=MMETSP0947-20121206/10356_1 /TAXON_ID=44440 /ORGANISM="Chattonella subsalsa, Strain CCMP2191" /LENGTH=231 /DNA_ID=CAMNT_0005568581 /DNA_START=137 /DNA_END=832 /DNA_ORIENTATION=-
MGGKVLDGCPYNAARTVNRYNLTNDDDVSCCLGARRMHVPASKYDFSWKKWRKTAVVTMLRDPLLRIESQFNYAFERKWIPNQGKSKAFNEEAVRIMEQQNVSTLEQYSSIWFMKNCQTKFLSGYDCAAPINVTNKEYKRALSVLEKLDFFGITDYWQESICLFHATFGLGPIDDPKELANSRPTAGARHLSIPETTQIILKQNENYDVQLFELGEKIFLSRAKLAGCLEK